MRAKEKATHPPFVPLIVRLSAHDEVQNPQLDKVSFAQKTAKLHMSFIANND